MSLPGSKALVDFSPPDGLTFAVEGECPLQAVSRDLCRIAAFLQALDPFGGLVRFEDWREHDGLFFELGPIDYHGLFELIQSPRSLLAATPDEEHVFVGIGPIDRCWYLRFRAEWDEQDEHIIGFWSMTVVGSLTQRFRDQVVLRMECVVRQT